jgi:hypothetical protein
MLMAKKSETESHFGVPRSSLRLSRATGIRPYRKLILIICEGTKTERYYFESLRNDFRAQTVKVEIADSKGDTSPLHIVEKAVTSRDKKRTAFDWDDENDEVWCVFDTEQKGKSPSLEQALRRAKQEGFLLAVSNPCFEYWYLLHYRGTDREFTNYKELSTILGDHIPGYHKNKPVYAILRPLMQTALHNASILIKRNPDHWSRIQNPSTGVNKLVLKIMNYYPL